MRKTKIIKTPLLFIHAKVTLWYSYDNIYKLYTYELSFPPFQVVRWTMCSVRGFKILYETCQLVFRLILYLGMLGEKFYSLYCFAPYVKFCDIRIQKFRNTLRKSYKTLMTLSFMSSSTYFIFSWSLCHNFLVNVMGFFCSK